MARRQRIHYEGAFYHVIARGNNRGNVLQADQDKKTYMAVADKFIQKYGAKLFAYVIMDNHIHLLIQVDEFPLSKVMQLIQQTYTSRYNRKYKHSGHVFEQRYKAILCDKDAYVLMLVRYIHQNPIRAGIGDLDYPWSSHREYAEGTAAYCDVDDILKIFSTDKGTAIQLYMNFVSELDETIKEKKAFEFEPDEVIRENISMDLEKKSVTEVIAQFEMTSGYSLDQIMLRYHSKATQSLKSQLIKELIKTTRFNQKELAEYLKVSPMTISRYMNYE